MSEWKEEVLYEGEKSLGVTLRVSITTPPGGKNIRQSFISIREWYADKETGELKPSKKGIAIPLDIGVEVGEAVMKADPDYEATYGEWERDYVGGESDK